MPKVSPLLSFRLTPMVADKWTAGMVVGEIVFSLMYPSDAIRLPLTGVKRLIGN